MFQSLTNCHVQQAIWSAGLTCLSYKLMHFDCCIPDRDQQQDVWELPHTALIGYASKMILASATKIDKNLRK